MLYIVLQVISLLTRYRYNSNMVVDDSLFSIYYGIRSYLWIKTPENIDSV